MTVDPVTAASPRIVPAIWNRYSQPGQDPANFIDSTGLECEFFLINGVWTLRCKEPLLPFSVPNQNPSNQDPSPVDIPANIFFQNPRNVWNLAQQNQSWVQDKLMNDCEAMANFAGQIASNWVGSGTGVDTIAESFSVFVGHNNIPAALRSYSSYVIPTVGNPLYLGTYRSADSQFDHDSGQGSGYANRYQDDDYPKLDQGHHFAAYFLFGFYNPNLTSSGIASFGLMLAETGLMGANTGDIYLGQEALRIGLALREGSLAPNNLYNEIAKLCQRGPQ